MKKWMYVIFPGIMLGLFLIVYTSHVKQAEERERTRIETAKRRADEELAKKKQAEELAAKDAQDRQKKREEEERQKEEDHRRKVEAEDKKVRDDTAQSRSEADHSAKEAAQLEIDLDRLHKQKETASREDFELAKQVELARVAKRNAELQQQHLTAMISQRAENSAMTALPPPPKK